MHHAVIPTHLVPVQLPPASVEDALDDGDEGMLGDEVTDDRTIAIQGRHTIHTVTVKQFWKVVMGLGSLELEHAHQWVKRKTHVRKRLLGGGDAWFEVEVCTGTYSLEDSCLGGEQVHCMARRLTRLNTPEYVL